LATVPTSLIYSRLGSKVSTRTISWLDQCVRAWGGEFNAPDHNIYVFSNGRGFDSTDRGQTGIYGAGANASGVNLLVLDTPSGNQYPDMSPPVNRLLQDNGSQILLD
jgi:hypothetical protein